MANENWGNYPGWTSTAARGECFFARVDFVASAAKAKLASPSAYWEAGTLPLSYTRPNHVHFNLKIKTCKEDVID